MTSPATDRQRLIDIATATLEELQSGKFSTALTESAPTGAIETETRERDTISDALTSALDWARMEKQAGEAAEKEEAVAGPSAVVPYIPSNQALSLLQSAFDEYLENRQAGGQGLVEIPFDTHDPGWLTIALEKLKAIVRGKHPFIKHASSTSFHINLPDSAVVALFSDWGTGEPTAMRVMDQIKLQQPTHAIHLGDVYYSGTPKEAKERFLDVIAAHGPLQDTCRYFSLNGNHDMYSGGYGYFDSILTRFGQPASYFNLGNQYWQLIGLDSGYQDFGLQDPQKEWLMAQLVERGPKSILMSHHQLFSPYDPRADDRTLLQKVTPLLPLVYGWFWGHEHRCVILGDHLGIKSRCIGHGAIPSNVPYGPPPFPAIPIQKVDERSAPPPNGGAIHGFALLRFAGARIDVSYIDEFGGEFFAERFGE